MKRGPPSASSSHSSQLKRPKSEANEDLEEVKGFKFRGSWVLKQLRSLDSDTSLRNFCLEMKTLDIPSFEEIITNAINARDSLLQNEANDGELSCVWAFKLEYLLSNYVNLLSSQELESLEEEAFVCKTFLEDVESIFKVQFKTEAPSITNLKKFRKLMEACRTWFLRWNKHSFSQ